MFFTIYSTHSMAPPRGKNAYKALWEREYDWLKPVENIHSAKCSLCETVFSIEASGKGNVVSHSKVSRTLSFIPNNKHIVILVNLKKIYTGIKAHCSEEECRQVIHFNFNILSTVFYGTVFYGTVFYSTVFIFFCSKFVACSIETTHVRNPKG